ncbi:MAG: ammonium transporter, partial [Verrucomicrobiales bacterium]
MKVPNQIRRYLGLLAFLLTTLLAGANSFSQDLLDPKAEEFAVTAEMNDADHADYSEGGIDAIGKQLYRYLQLGGERGTLTPEQLVAVEGYFDRYLDSPFFGLSNLWVLICAFLVFLMHLGFSTLESGLTQSKNTVNILFKNVFIISSGLLLYWIWGFNAMYPGDGWMIGDIFAMGSPWDGAPGDNGDLSYGGTSLLMTGWTDFLFQAMFAATAATIVSGAVAERVKLPAFMIFAVLLVGIAYPISGGWKWGAGWLDDMGFYDFAGSSVVHAFGGFAALACVLVLGPRKGKYTSSGIKPILGSSMPLATIGVFLLWLGWFGFNGGSVLSADPALISYVCVTTALAASAGALASIVVSWTVLKKPDLSMALNGILAGLVGITAGADSVGIWPAIFI